jgi:hypothetical protein
MNFKNMKKILKKNYKKIIVVCLIMLLLSNKMYENFTPTEALDAVKATEKKVNDIFYNIDKDWSRSNKGIYSKKEIKAKTIRSTEDIIAARNMTASGNVNAKKDVNASGKISALGDVKGKRLCIGATCIDEKNLQVLTGKKYFSIQSGRSNKRLQDDNENARFDNHNDHGHEAHRIIAIRNK